MTDDDFPEHDDVEPGTIGVGMGGSCPVCRAPVDLGQEFCLECGSPIRFTPRQRRQPRPGARPGAPAAVPVAPRRSGFPWIPFLVVLALVGSGVAFALVESGNKPSSSSNKDTKTEPALPTITNETPDATSSGTETSTFQDCDPLQPLGDTQPAVADGSALDPSTDEQIPELTENGTAPPIEPGGFDQGEVDAGVPSVEPSESSPEAMVTVDQNGDLCAEDTSTSPDDGPIDPSTDSDAGATTDDPTSTADEGTTTSGDWPSGKEGWTVIVAGYPNEARATQRSADVQEDGYDDSGVLFSTDFQSLCPGFHVVFSGVLDTEPQAERRLAELSAKPDYAGMYVREIRTSGSRPSSCTQVR